LIFLAIQDTNGQGSQGESLALSALTDTEGYWYVNFGNARTITGDTFQFEETDQVEMRVIYPEFPPALRTIPVSATFPAAPLLVTQVHQLYLPNVAR
jgi:hypothetical protein